MIAINLSQQQVLDTNLRTIKQIKFADFDFAEFAIQIEQETQEFTSFLNKQKKLFQTSFMNVTALSDLVLTLSLNTVGDTRPVFLINYC